MVFSFFRGGREAETSYDSGPQVSLADEAWRLHQRIDASYPDLGPFATVMAKRVLDGVAAILRQAGGQERLDLRATVTLERMLLDYLPTTLRTYSRARQEASALEELERQLVHLTAAVEDTLVAVRENNLQDLQVQGDFLETKYKGSDLQL